MSGVNGEGLPAAAKRIDQNSEQGKALQQVVQTKLKDFLGADYADDVLPLYIVVMLAHGNQAELVAESLEAFLGQGHAELFVQWLFDHLAEVGDKYAAPDQEGSISSASASQDGTSGKAGSEDGEASAMELDNAQVSPGKPQQLPVAAQHDGHADQGSLDLTNGKNNHAARQQATEPADHRRSQRRMSHDRADERIRGRQSPRNMGPNSYAQDSFDRPRDGHHRQASNRHDQPHRRQPDNRWSDHRDRGGYDDYHPSQSYSTRRHSPGYHPNSRQALPYGDRGSRDRDRDAPRGHMRSRREMDSRDHYSGRDREPKRRRSDPMGDGDVRGHHPARDDRESRPHGSRMRSDAIIAQAAEQRQQQQQQAEVGHDPNAVQRGPTVRSVVQRVSSAEAEEDEQQDRMAAARSRGKQPIRLFETAMRQVSAPPGQPNRPSVFDRLTSQAAQGNNAAAVTTFAVVRSAAAAAVNSQGGGDNSSIAAMKQQLQHMEQEVTKLRRQQQAVLSSAAALPTAAAAAPVGALADAASVVVQNVHFAATPQILAAHFSGCGPASRATILKDKMTGHPTGTAYLQFLTPTQAAAALALTGSLLLQRPIAVMPKASKPSYALTAHTGNPSHQGAFPRLAAQPYNPFVDYQPGSRGYAPRGRGRGRGRASRGQPHVNRGGRSSVRGGRGSDNVKSNVYIRPGIKQ